MTSAINTTLHGEDMQVRAAPHPSRTAHKCIDCQHALTPYPNQLLLYCGHPSMPVRLDDGRPLVRCETARTAREWECGQSARLFAACSVAGA